MRTIEVKLSEKDASHVEIIRACMKPTALSDAEVLTLAAECLVNMYKAARKGDYWANHAMTALGLLGDRPTRQ